MTNQGQLNFYDFNTAWKYLDIEEVRPAIDFFKGFSDRYGKTHGFGYPGEALERFVEKETIVSMKRIRSLAFAVCSTYKNEYEFYQEQKVNFGDRLSSTLEMKEDGVLQALVAYWNVMALEKDWDETFFTLLENNEERAALLEVLLVLPEQEKVRGIILKLLAQVNTDLLFELSVYAQTDVLRSLTFTYESLRPKKGECKGFVDVYELAIQAWRLSKKELQVNLSQPSSEEAIKPFTDVFQCDSQDLMTLHYLLFTWDRDWVKTAEVAKERVFGQWLKAELTSSRSYTEEFASYLAISGFSREEIAVKISNWLHEVNHSGNLIFIEQYTENFSLLVTTPAVVSQLNQPYFNKENSHQHISNAIHIEHYSTFAHEADVCGFSKVNLLTLMEKKRVEWELTTQSSETIASMYLQDLVTEGIYDMLSYQEWDALGLYAPFIHYLDSTKCKTPDWYVTTLETIPLEDREFLFKSRSSHWYSEKELDFSNTVFELTNLKSRYLSVVMQSIYFYEPKNYGSALYNFYSQGILEKAGLTEDEINVVLKNALAQNLFLSYDKNKIAEKFMSDDEKFLKELNSAIRDLENAYSISSLKSSLEDSEELLKDSRFQEALVTGFTQIAVDSYRNPLKSLYQFIKSAEANLHIEKTTIENLKKTFDEKIIQSNKFKEEDIEYLEHISQVLTTHYQNKKDEEENTTCQTAM